MNQELLSVSQLIKVAWENYKSKLLVILGIVTPSIFASVFVFILLSDINNVNKLIPLVVLPIVVIINLVSQSSLIFLFTKADKQNVVSAYSGGLKYVLPFIWISILTSAVVFGGMLLFFIPGIIFSIWFCLGVIALYDEDKRGMDALMASKSYVEGNWGSVLWRMFVFSALSFAVSLLVAIISLPIIMFVPKLLSDIILMTVSLFVVGPLFMSYLVALYQNLKQIKAGNLLPQNKTPFIVLGILSIFIIPTMIIGSLLYGAYSVLTNADWKSESSIKLTDDSGKTLFENTATNSNKKDCGTNWDCLIESARSCGQSSFKNNINSDLFGVNMKAEGVLEVRGEENGGCKLYGRNDKYSVTFPAGVPAEIIEQTNAEYKKIEGKEYNCIYKTKENLVSVLTNWKAGNFDNQVMCPGDGSKCEYGGDFKSAVCTGSLFGQTPDTGVKYSGTIVAPSETANWETYKEISGTYTVKYPSNWKLTLDRYSSNDHQVLNARDPISSYGIGIDVKNSQYVNNEVKSLDAKITGTIGLNEYLRNRDASVLMSAPSQIKDRVKEDIKYTVSTEKNITSTLCPSNYGCEATQRQEVYYPANYAPEKAIVLVTYIYYKGQLLTLTEIVDSYNLDRTVYPKIISSLILHL